MSEYSISSNGSLRRRLVRCYCGKEAPVVTGWTKQNPGRRFYGCGEYENFGVKQCKFFVWYDQDFPPRAKELIWSFMKKDEGLKTKVVELNRNVDHLKKKVAEVKEAKRAHHQEMKKKNNMLWGFLAISWIIISILVFALVVMV